MRGQRALAVIAASLILFASQAGGQQPVHRIGVLSVMGGPEMMQSWLEGLRERGYVESGNLQIEYRSSQARTEQIPALVAELVAFGPEVIVAESTPNAVAVHAAAPTIPLVFVNVGDPVAVGLVESLGHPGGNVTGFALILAEGFTGKQLQFLKAIVPQASRIGRTVQSHEPRYPARAGEAPRHRATAGSGVVRRRGKQAGSIRVGLRDSAHPGCRGDQRLRRSAIFDSPGEGRGARCSLSKAGDVLQPGDRTGRRTDILWSGQSGPLAWSWHLRGQNPQGRETW
jgi:ABC transporter substrate binding protein